MLDIWHHLLDRWGRRKIGEDMIRSAIFSPTWNKSSLWLHCRNPNPPWVSPLSFAPFNNKYVTLYFITRSIKLGLHCFSFHLSLTAFWSAAFEQMGQRGDRTRSGTITFPLWEVSNRWSSRRRNWDGNGTTGMENGWLASQPRLCRAM